MGGKKIKRGYIIIFWYDRLSMTNLFWQENKNRKRRKGVDIAIWVRVHDWVVVEVEPTVKKIYKYESNKYQNF